MEYIDINNKHQLAHYCFVCEKYIQITTSTIEFHELFNYKHQQVLLQNNLKKLYNTINFSTQPLHTIPSRASHPQ